MKWGILISRNEKLETTILKIDQILRVVKGKSPPQTIMQHQCNYDLILSNELLILQVMPQQQSPRFP